MPLLKKIYEKDAKIGLWQLSESVEELEQLILVLLSNEEKQKYPTFKSEQRKKEWLATRILLKDIKKSPFHTIISYNDACKPFTKDENISISHSREYVGVIISEKNEVSIDVEKISKKTIKIADKFLSEEEKLNFDYKKPEIATLLWSAKETVYKFYSKKNLPFIDGIKIIPTKIDENGTINAILLQKTKLEVQYLYIYNNVLTFIVNSNK